MVQCRVCLARLGRWSGGMSQGAPIMKVTLRIGGFGSDAATSGGLTHLDEQRYLSWYTRDPAASLAFAIAGALSESPI